MTLRISVSAVTTGMMNLNDSDSESIILLLLLVLVVLYSESALAPPSRVLRLLTTVLRVRLAVPVFKLIGGFGPLARNLKMW